MAHPFLFLHSSPSLLCHLPHLRVGQQGVWQVDQLMIIMSVFGKIDLNHNNIMKYSQGAEEAARAIWPWRVKCWTSATNILHQFIQPLTLEISPKLLNKLPNVMSLLFCINENSECNLFPWHSLDIGLQRAALPLLKALQGTQRIFSNWSLTCHSCLAVIFPDEWVWSRISCFSQVGHLDCSLFVWNIIAAQAHCYC